MGKLIDLTGQRFGRLVVKERALNTSSGKTCWICLCDCGSQKIVVGNDLKSGKTKSCGCARDNIFQDLTNQRFGKLVVQKRYSVNTKSGAPQWICKCDCGQTTIVSGHNLREGKTKSCGCSRKGINATHGFTRNNFREKLYSVWEGIHQRCDNPHNKAYHNYGGRGIKMCSEWRESYPRFREWAYQNGYAEGLQIDRINNDGNYEPSNCRFVSPTANAQNRRVPKNNTSGYSGIEYRPKQHDYRVVISVGGVHQHVGLYASLEEAVAARKEAELKYWGYIKNE